MERLDAGPIAHQEQLPLRHVPDREGEDSAQPQHAVVTPLFIGTYDDLSVTVRSETPSALLQLTTQFPEVVNLAVEDDPHAAVVVGQRLIATLQIDDGQSSESQADASTLVEPTPVGTAMMQRPDHPRQQLTIDRLLSVVGEDSGETAHRRVNVANVAKRGREAGHWVRVVTGQSLREVGTRCYVTRDSLLRDS